MRPSTAFLTADERRIIRSAQWRGGCHKLEGGEACADSLSTGYLCAVSPTGEAKNGRRNWRRGFIPAERHLLGRGRGQERVQRCGYAAFCLNSQKGEQQDRRGDYPRISTNPRLGDLHRHRREALRAPDPAAGRRRLPPVAFQGVLGDLVNNQVPPLFRIYIKSDHLERGRDLFQSGNRLWDPAE